MSAGFIFRFLSGLTLGFLRAEVALGGSVFSSYG